MIRTNLRIIIIVFINLVSFTNHSFCQSTFNQIYQLLNSASCGNNSNSCHNNSAPSGLKFNQTEAQLYSDLFNQTPQNTTATSRKDKLVYPGHPYRSFLFRKINNGLAHNVDLVSGEGVSMPQSSPALNEKQIELIRQWIIYGAPQTGQVIDINLINDFYDNSGINSVPNPPTAPDPSEGFQLHAGPIFLAPGAETLIGHDGAFMRFDVELNDTVEITKLENVVGWGFHHSTFFIKRDATGLTNVPQGVFYASDYPTVYQSFKLFSGFQTTNTLELPSGSAFNAPNGLPFLFEAHHANTSQTNVMACDMYLNVYTQPKNTALQLMKSMGYNYSNPMFGNPPLVIPPDGQTHVFSQQLYDSLSSEERYIWAIMPHSHEHTVFHDVYARNPNGSKGEKLYEGACPDGLPHCSSPVFQPSEIPTRRFNNFFAMPMNEGIIHEAGFRNNGADTIFYGLHAYVDEMMSLAYYYISDTTGIGLTDNISELNNTKQNEVIVYPNPFSNMVSIDWSKTIPANLSVNLRIFNITGQTIYKSDNLTSGKITLSGEKFPAQGMYFFQLEYQGSIASGKLNFE